MIALYRYELRCCLCDTVYKASCDSDVCMTSEVGYALFSTLALRFDGFLSEGLQTRPQSI